MLVRDVMTEDPLTLECDSSVNLADELMKFAHIRHLPVVEDRRVVGLVTHRDLVRVLATWPSEEWTSVPVCRIMQHGIVTTRPDESLEVAISKLLDHKFGCLPVVDDGRLVGIVTEADFLRWAVGVLASANS